MVSTSASARHHSEIQRYLRNVMSIRLLMSALSFVLLAAVLYSIGLTGLLVPGFFLMVLTSYSSLLRNGLYAVQQLGYEAIAVVLVTPLNFVGNKLWSFRRR